MKLDGGIERTLKELQRIKPTDIVYTTDSCDNVGNLHVWAQYAYGSRCRVWLACDRVECTPRDLPENILHSSLKDVVSLTVLHIDCQNKEQHLRWYNEVVRLFQPSAALLFTENDRLIRQAEADDFHVVYRGSTVLMTNYYCY